MPTPLSVAVRIRPRLYRDGEGKTTEDTTVVGNQIAVAGQPNEYAFTQTFGSDASQVSVYQHCAAPQVAAVLEGFDACVFAFGQTGAGKTYSMIGLEGGRSQAQDGILPLAAAEIFRTVAQLSAAESCQYRLSATFVEVHREGVFDLLATQRTKVGVREADEGAVVDGATILRIRSVDGLLRAVSKGVHDRGPNSTRHLSVAPLLC